MRSAVEQISSSSGFKNGPVSDNQRSAASEKKSLNSHSKVILMIDNDSADRTAIRKIVEAKGYQFSEAQNGHEGLNTILKKYPDLVLLDFGMKGMDGAGVLEELVGNPRYKEVCDTPVVMLATQTRDEVNQAHLFQLGLQMYLEKPFAGHELINVIENVFALNELHIRNRELEQRIRRTEYKYQDLIENTSDLIFTLNSQGNFIFINRRLSVLAGHLREAWEDRSILEMILPEDRHHVEVNFRNTLRGKSRIFEMRIRSQTGRMLHLSTNINPIFERGEVVGCVGIARDVTQRKRLEQEITDLKNFNESIIQSIGSGLMTINLERRISSFNQAAEEITKWSAYEILGKHIDKILSEHEAQTLLPIQKEKAERSYLLHQEMELTRKDGKRIHIGFTVTPRRDNLKQRVGTIVSFRDISQIKQMQAEVLRMDRLASLGVLASGIAHEIRNPLAGIKTVAQTLEEDLEEGDGKREYVARIIRQVNRMDELLRTLFSYARPKSPIRQYHHIYEIINEVKALTEKRLDKVNIQFEENYAHGLQKIYVDGHQIQQVFLNLFLNAIDAMPKGGCLSIFAKPVTTALQPVDRREKRYPQSETEFQYSQVCITDTGIGIAKENLAGIFDPFFTTKPHGTGLGLSIVYRIIEEHGGDIKIDSEPEIGTTFTLLLPTHT